MQTKFNELLGVKEDDLSFFAAEMIKLLHKTEVKDSFLLSKLGRELRDIDKKNDNQNCSLEYIEHLMMLGVENFTSNKFIMAPFTWCVYHVKIKSYEYEENTYNDFIEWSNIVLNNCIQQPLEKTHTTPFVITILKIIKVLRGKPSTSYYQLLDFVNKLNPKELSSEPYGFVDDKGKDRELASPKEIYFQTKSKCLEKLKRHEECFQFCEYALDNFNEWHYRNDLWISARMWYSKCKVSYDESSINEYKSIAEREKFWYMYHKIGNIFLSSGNTEDALYYFNKALVSGEIDPEKMINLFFDLALIWENHKKTEIARKFYQACYYYRKRYVWTISEELEFAKLEYEFNVDSQPSLKKLQKISADFISKHDKMLLGRVSTIDYVKKFGFISYENKSMHFNFKAAPIRLKKNDHVFFDIKVLDDGRKTANYIIKRVE